MDSDGGPLVLPLGHYLGRDRDDADAAHRIRIGSQCVWLSPQEVKVWLAAHGSQGTVYQRPWTVDAVRSAAGLPAATFDDALGGLDHAVVQVPVSGDDAVRFAATHQLRPLLAGLGEWPQAPGWFALGRPGDPVTELPTFAYEVWQWASVADSLWSLCNAFALAEWEIGDIDDTGDDPEQVLADVLGCLHPILAGRAGYLDTR